MTPTSSGPSDRAMSASEPKAVLMPAAQARAGSGAARTMRIMGGASGLVLMHPDGLQEALCPADGIRRIIHVRDRDLDHVLIVTQERAWALPLAAWTPGLGVGLVQWDRRRQLEAAGILRLARVLGTPLVLASAERGATLEDVAGVPTVIVLDPRPAPPTWLPLVRWPALAIWVGAFVWLILTARRGATQLDTDPFSLALEWAALLVPLIWVVAAKAAGGWSSADGSEPPSGPAAVRGSAFRPCPAGPVTRRFLQRAWLWVGSEELAVGSAYGWEAWLPGPVLGGVTEVLFAEAGKGDRGRTGQVQFVHQEAGVLAALPLQDWVGGPGGTEMLSGLLEAAGLRVRRQPGSPLLDVDPRLGGRPASGVLVEPPNALPEIDRQLSLYALILSIAIAVGMRQPLPLVVVGLPSIVIGATWLRRRVSDRRLDHLVSPQRDRMTRP